MKNLFKLILQVSLSPILLQSIFNDCCAQKNTSTPTKISNVKNGDSIEKIFYDANTNILEEQDSIHARYFRIINYKDGKIHGSVTDYYISGKPLMIGYYSNNNASKGYENGKFIWYYENGNVFQSCSYVNGILDGAYIEYYPSGLKKALVSYSKGKRYGCEYAWDEIGKLIHKGFIENDILIDRAECDTNYIITGQTISEVEIKKPEPQENSQINSAEKSIKKIDSDSNIRQISNKECEKNNTGDYCFTNSTQKSLIVTLYIPGQNTGNYIQINRFDNVSIKWSNEATIDSGQTKCFHNLNSASVSYLIRDPTISISYAENGDVIVEKCKSKTFIIK
jgi:hypothetical protein